MTFIFVGPPRVTVHPASLRLKKGATAVLSCNASSPLPVHVTWYKNGQPIPSGNQLVIDNLQNEDQGDYYCKFSTELMSSFSNGALLVIEGLCFYEIVQCLNLNGDPRVSYFNIILLDMWLQQTEVSDIRFGERTDFVNVVKVHFQSFLFVLFFFLYFFYFVFIFIYFIFIYFVFYFCIFFVLFLFVFFFSFFCL